MLNTVCVFYNNRVKGEDMVPIKTLAKELTKENAFDTRERKESLVC